MKKTTGAYPGVHLDATDNAAVGQVGGIVLVETIRASGLHTALSEALGPWRKPLAVHDPAKALLDLAMALAVGGDCLADVNLLRADPASTVGWPQIRRSPGSSITWPMMSTRCWPPSRPSARLPGPGVDARG